MQQKPPNTVTTASLPNSESLSDWHRNGYAIVPDVLTAETVDRLLMLVETARRREDRAEAVANRSGVYALRNLTDVIPEILLLLQLPSVQRILQNILSAPAFLVRSTLFDKTVGANWGVFWHQDLSIAVCERYEVPGFRAWTKKAGVVSVQPPAELMSRIVAVRLHLDDCTINNGALRVLPGTHISGRLDAGEVETAASAKTEVICEVPAGGAVLMNPLTLHSSLPMTTAEHRRVIHLEFADFDLTAPLQWKYRIPVTQE